MKNAFNLVYGKTIIIVNMSNMKKKTGVDLEQTSMVGATTLY